MTFDAVIEAFAESDELPVAAMQAATDDWAADAPRYRALLRGYLAGQDLSERTEQALFVVVHLLGQMEDHESFADLCALALDPQRFESVLGEDCTVLSYPAILVSTFGGDPAPLHRMIEHPDADELARGDALLVLAYLTRTGRIPERDTYDYLAGLPARLRPEEENFIWFGYARAVAALGFGGLSGAVEAVIARGLIAADLMTSAHFWQDMRDSQQAPADFASPVWDNIGPLGSAIDHLVSLGDAADPEGGDSSAPLKPLQNPLRGVGRNDPCPCGSGKKFKKCCLPAM